MRLKIINLIPSQRHFPFAELQVVSTQMRLNIVYSYTVSAIPHFWHDKSQQLMVPA